MRGHARLCITREAWAAGRALVEAGTVARYRNAAAPSATDETGMGSAGQHDAAGGTYQSFVEALAGELGVGDAGTVDTAIRAALKSIVEERLAAGEIAANNAEALKAQIDANEAPLNVGRFGKLGGPGRGVDGPGRTSQDLDSNDPATPEATQAGWFLSPSAAWLRCRVALGVSDPKGLARERGASVVRATIEATHA